MSDIIQRAFNVGEVSEEYWLRNDLDWYNRSVRSLKNFIPTVGGSLQNRPGTLFRHELPFRCTQLEKLDTFYLAVGIHRVGLSFSNDDIYIAAFNNSTLHTTIVNYAALSPLCNIEFLRQKIPSYDNNSFLLTFRNIDDTNLLAYPILFCNYTASWTTTRLVTSSYNLLAPTISVNIPGGAGAPVYYQVSTVTSDGVESAPSAIVSHNGNPLTAANPATISWNEPAYNGYAVARYYVYRVEAGVSRFVGDTVASAPAAARTFVDYAFDRDVNLGPVQSTYDGSQDITWGGGADYTTASSICGHQQRLIGAKANAYFGSRTGVPKSLYYSAPLSATDSFFANLIDVGELKYARSTGGELMLFGTYGIWVARGDNAGSLTPTAAGVDLRWVDSIGNHQPLVYRNGVIYGTLSAEIKALIRNPNGGPGYTQTSLSQYTYAFSPIPYFAVRADSCTLIPNGVWTVQETESGYDWRSVTINAEGTDFAWAHHETDGVVLAAKDDYIIVERVINGVTKWYVEQFATRVDDRATGVYLDSAVRVFVTGTTVSGLTHLIGKSVYAVVEGLKQGPFVVNGSGQITLEAAYFTTVTVGLPYESTVTTHDVDLVAAQTLVRQPKATSCVNVYFKNTANGEVRVNNDPWQEIRLRDESDGYGPIALKTGLTEDIHVSTSPRREQTVSIRQTEPFPMTITAIARSLKGA